MTLLHSMGIISTIALLVPIILLLVYKLAWYKSFPALLFYYIILLSYNIISQQYLTSFGPSTGEYHKVINNLLEVPLVLLFFTYFRKFVFVLNVFIFFHY